MLYTINDIKAAALKGRCRHWFDESSMEFFDSIVYSEVFPVDKGTYFITSEQNHHGPAGGHHPSPDGYDSDPRMWSVRFCSLDGLIETVGEFQQHETYESARAAIKYITTFQWERDVPTWVVLKFAEAGKLIPGLYMTDWKATPKGGKLTTYDPTNGVVTGQMYR